MPKYVIGVDEVGLGCLAGPVVAAAVVLPDLGKSRSPIQGLADSKKLSSNRRAELSPVILKEAVYWFIARSDIELINKHGIKRCHHDCMHFAAKVCKILFPEALIIVDGNRPIDKLGHHRCIVKADAKIPAVSAASIIAKVHRDNLMVKMAEKYPWYGWEENKGYGSPAHLKALKEHGVTPQHRIHYGPVKELLKGEKDAYRRERQSLPGDSR